MDHSQKRANLAKAIYDLGKLSFAALVIGQFISPQLFQPITFFGGLLFTLIAFGVAYATDR